MRRVGIISDTHGLLRPQALAYLVGVDHIIHAGDIGNASILAQLSAIAPVTSVRGNNDQGPWADLIPETEIIRIEELCFYVLHDLAELDIDPQAAGIQVVVSGHSHKPAVFERDAVLYINPGSAGPRRFSLPVTAGQVVIDRGQVSASTAVLLEKTRGEDR